jgi:hypothetical protein
MMPAARAPQEGSATSDLGRACHAILDAAAILLINLDYLSRGADGEKRDAVADAQSAVDRIVAIARAIRPPSPTREPGAGDRE